MKLWLSAAARNIRTTTASAQHQPLPFVPVDYTDLLLPVEERGVHKPRATWFWTGVLLGISFTALAGTLLCRALGA